MTIKLQLKDREWLRKYNKAYYELFENRESEDEEYIDGYAFGQLLGYTSTLMNVYDQEKIVAILSRYENLRVVQEIIYEYDNLYTTLSQDELYKYKSPSEIEAIAKGMLEMELEVISEVYQYMSTDAIHKYFHYNFDFVFSVVDKLKDNKRKLEKRGITYTKKKK